MVPGPSHQTFYRRPQSHSKTRDGVLARGSLFFSNRHSFMARFCNAFHFHNPGSESPALLGQTFLFGKPGLEAFRGNPSVPWRITRSRIENADLGPNVAVSFEWLPADIAHSLRGRKLSRPPDSRSVDIAHDSDSRPDDPATGHKAPSRQDRKPSG